MTSRLTELSVDCADPAALARFWAAALGYEVLEESADLVEIGLPGVSDAQRLEDVRSGPVAPSLVFATVPEGKSVKNRLHLDLSPVDGDQDGEIARLEALGARRTDLAPDGATWVVMHDPEGNEFCVLRSLAPDHFSL
jgi:glyoxalase superfamily protein